MAATERHLRRRRHRDDPHRPGAPHAPATGAVVSFAGVEKRYSATDVALDGISFDIYPGEFVFLVGQSGSGKSTTMRLLIKEADPTAGEIRVAGRVIVHLGSAELVDATMRAQEPDLLLLCVAGWTSSRDLPERVARALSPKAVLLSHWDDFFRPLDRPARMLPAMQLPRLVDRLSRATRDAKIGTIPLLGEVWV